MMETNPRILIVDDQTDSVALLLNYLKGLDVDIMVARNGADGLRKAHKGRPDAILLDVGMPDLDGYEVCRRVRGDLRMDKVPIIFLSASTAVEDKLQGFAAGGVDYITKPFSAEEVLARLSVHLRVKRRLDRLETLAAEGAARDIAARLPSQNDPVADTVAELQRDPAAWPGLTELARRVGTNEKKLTELFRRRFGMTTFEYLVDLRLETARRQLETTALQIQVIATHAGFGNASDFSRAFRRRYGVTPREFRQTRIAGDPEPPN